MLPSTSIRPLSLWAALPTPEDGGRMQHGHRGGGGGGGSRALHWRGGAAHNARGALGVGGAARCSSWSAPLACARPPALDLDAGITMILYHRAEPPGPPRRRLAGASCWGGGRGGGRPQPAVPRAAPVFAEGGWWEATSALQTKHQGAADSVAGGAGHPLACGLRRAGHAECSSPQAGACGCRAGGGCMLSPGTAAAARKHRHARISLGHCCPSTTWLWLNAGADCVVAL